MTIMPLTGNMLSAAPRFSPPARRPCILHHQAVNSPPTTTSNQPPARGQVITIPVKSRQMAAGIR